MSTSATFNRRTIMKYGAAAGALATIGASALPAQAHGSAGVLPAPRPIPGGIQIPGGPLIHVHAPGPTSPLTERTSPPAAVLGNPHHTGKVVRRRLHYPNTTMPTGRTPAVRVNAP